jgi:hypothetical protein
MTKRDELKNVAASVRDRLKKIADKNSEDVWKAFWKKSVKTHPALTLEDVVSFAASFLVLPAIAAAKGEKFARQWKAGGPWI